MSSAFEATSIMDNICQKFLKAKISLLNNLSRLKRWKDSIKLRIKKRRKDSAIIPHNCGKDSGIDIEKRKLRFYFSRLAVMKVNFNIWTYANMRTNRHASGLFASVRKVSVKIRNVTSIWLCGSYLSMKVHCTHVAYNVVAFWISYLTNKNWRKTGIIF